MSLLLGSSGPMKLWHAIGVQLLSIAVREQARLSKFEDNSIQVTCNCTGSWDRSWGAASEHPHPLVFAFVFFAGVATGTCIVLYLKRNSNRNPDGDLVGGGARRRGGGILS